MAVGPDRPIARRTALAVKEEHAKLEHKNGRVLCTALGFDEMQPLSDTHTWMNGTQLRHGVSYMVAPGSVLQFGTPPARACSCLVSIFDPHLCVPVQSILRVCAKTPHAVQLWCTVAFRESAMYHTQAVLIWPALHRRARWTGVQG